MHKPLLASIIMPVGLDNREILAKRRIMPVLKSSKKALKVSIRRKKENDTLRKSLREAVKALRGNPSFDTLKKVYSLLDRATRKHIFHKNRAARLKSNFSKLVKTPLDTKLPKRGKPATKPSKKSR